MSETTKQLRKLHTLHLRIRDIQSTREQSSRVLRKDQARIDLCEKNLGQHQEKIRRLKIAIHENEVSIKGREQNITKYQEQMNKASTRKEYDALRHEIENEKNAIAGIEDQILDTMGELEDATKLLPTLEESLETAKKEYDAAAQLVDGRKVDLETRIEDARVELNQVKESLDPELRAAYDRQVTARGDDALAPLSGTSCSGCYIALTPQNQHDVRIGRLMNCKSCGRLLYLPE